MSWLDKLIDAGATLDWVSRAISISRDFSNEWETVVIEWNGTSPNQIAKEYGKKWEVGFVDSKNMQLTLHRKK